MATQTKTSTPESSSSSKPEQESRLVTLEELETRGPPVKIYSNGVLQWSSDEPELSTEEVQRRIRLSMLPKAKPTNSHLTQAERVAHLDRPDEE